MSREGRVRAAYHQPAAALERLIQTVRDLDMDQVRALAALTCRSRSMLETLPSDWVAEQKLPNPWVG